MTSCVLLSSIYIILQGGPDVFLMSVYETMVHIWRVRFTGAGKIHTGVQMGILADVSVSLLIVLVSLLLFNM